MKPKINTFIVGAQKAGTSSLYDWLGQHPAIWAPPEIKDYHFFTENQLYQEGEDHINNFYKQQNASINLYASVNYLYFYDVAAKRIYDYNPNAKIIICLRNPVDRAVSAYKYVYRVMRETYSFDEAISREIQNNLKKEERADKTYIEHGKYLEQIRGYLHYFNKKQIHFVFFEELVDPDKQDEVMKNILLFLGLDPHFSFHYAHKNVSGQPRWKWLNYFLRKNETINFKWLLPYKIRKRLYRWVEEWNISSSKKIEVNINETKRKELWVYFEDEIEELASITGKDLRTLWQTH